MSEAQVTDKQGRAAVTSLVTAGSVLLGSALLAAGCASSGPPARSPVSQGPASQSPAARGTAATTAELTAMAARYMAIARPANRELDHEFDGFDDHVKDGDLAAARADLRAAVVTERRFDRQLIALSCPPRTEPFVRLLYRVNQARAELTSAAAGVTSLRELSGYQRRLDAANEPVEDAVRVIRAQLGLPPPDTS
jgi:DNA-binding GntR family transcriptional regulator